jgi:TolA-binding protein
MVVSTKRTTPSPSKRVTNLSSSSSLGARVRTLEQHVAQLTTTVNKMQQVVAMLMLQNPQMQEALQQKVVQLMNETNGQSIST